MSQTLTPPASPTSPRKLSLPQFAHTPAPYAGPSKAEVLADRNTYLSPGLFKYYKDPLMIVEGKMQYLYDETGKRYLDAFAGIVTVSVGHCHPKVIAAVNKQNETLQHTTTIYLNPNIGAFAKNLANHFPAGSNLTQSYFTNSGSEANELAVLASREFTGHHEILSLRNGYHGGTASTMNLTAHGNWKFKSNPGMGVKNATPAYCYRCPFGLTYPSCNLKCATDTKELIQYETSGQIAMFIGECIQGVGGTIVPPKEYFKIVYDIVKQHGGLTVADEVQGGFGRTGTKFWAFENWDVTPDIVTMAKGIGNGAPLGALTTRPEIAKMFANRVHFNTFGGNPVTMAQAQATLQVIDEDHIQQNALKVGAHLLNRLKELQEKHSIIGDVRGMGLMIGVELVKDRKSKEPASQEAATLLNLAKDRNLLLGKGGLYGNVLRIKPPMCITKDDADYMMAVLDEVLPECSSANT